MRYATTKIVLTLLALGILIAVVQSNEARIEVMRLWCHYVEDTEYIPVATFDLRP